MVKFRVYGNWCGSGYSGPGTPIDDVDACCKSHDQCYDQKPKRDVLPEELRKACP